MTFSFIKPGKRGCSFQDLLHFSAQKTRHKSLFRHTHKNLRRCLLNNKLLMNPHNFYLNFSLFHFRLPLNMDTPLSFIITGSFRSKRIFNVFIKNIIFLIIKKKISLHSGHILRIDIFILTIIFAKMLYDFPKFVYKC